MSKYGELLDSGFNFERVNAYNTLTAYFENPKLRLVKTFQKYFVYACEIKSMLGRQKRYLLLTTDKSYGDHDVLMNEIEWLALETRTLDQELNVPEHAYESKTLNAIIKVFDKSDPNQYKYICSDLNLNVTLLFTKTQSTPYRDSGYLGLALETYQCILRLD